MELEVYWTNFAEDKLTDIFEYYKIPKNSKILLATMSSYDEVFSAFVINKFPKSKYVSTVYKNQFEWILDTINFVSTIENVYLIVRVHPRTFSNKRENVISKESNDLINIFYHISLFDLFFGPRIKL